MKKVAKCIFWLLIVVSIIILIRYSNLKIMIQSTGIASILLKPDSTDGIAFNLSIGYLVSVIFYVLIVYYPEKTRKHKIEKVAINELSGICTDILMLFVLMYKNVSEESEWDFDDYDDDSKLINEKFYNNMSKFDAYSKADTLIIKIEDDGTKKELTWDDKLEKDLGDAVKNIDNLLTKYLIYLDDSIIDKILSLRNSIFMTSYLGLSTNRIMYVYEGHDGNKYAERVSLNSIRKDSTSNHTGLFGSSKDVDNINMLVEFMDALLDVRKLCIKRTDFSKKLAIEYYIKKGCGRFSIAKLN